MRHLTSALLSLFLTAYGSAQNLSFQLATPQPLLNEVYSGSILSGDLDNDGDMDIVQSGIGENMEGFVAEPTIFLNDGSGNFTPTDQTFSNFFTTEQIVMGDLDGDDDLDLIITSENRTDYYRNNGQARFTFEEGAPFLPSISGEVIIGDVDDDGDNDVLQFGRVTGRAPFAVLFLNDGAGTFSEAPDQNFMPVAIAQIAFIDLEGDGDQDVVSFGRNDDRSKVINLYANDGSGNYTAFGDGNIEPLLASGLSIGDVDNDGDEDILITGSQSDFTAKTALYLNNGSGQFSNVADTGFPDLFSGTSAFADLDNDDDLDLLLIGSMNGGGANIFSLVFENTGEGNFAISDSLGGEYIVTSTIADLNGDGKKDIIIQGFVDDTNIYWNETFVSSVRNLRQLPMTVFPNPTRGNLHLTWTEGDFNRIEVMDQNGRMIHNGIITRQGVHTISLNASAGLYVVQAYGSEGVASKKIIITE